MNLAFIALGTSFAHIMFISKEGDVLLFALGSPVANKSIGKRCAKLNERLESTQPAKLMRLSDRFSYYKQNDCEKRSRSQRGLFKANGFSQDSKRIRFDPRAGSLA